MAAKRKDVTIFCPTDRCDICHRTGTKIVCDHDYRTDLIRGWLCDTCNQALGMLGDTRESLQRAIDYLEASPRGETYSQYRREQVRVQQRELRQRRRDDPAWQEKQRARGRKKFERMQADPIWREKDNERQRKRYHALKAVNGK